MNFLKVGQTWFNLETITRVIIIEHKAPASIGLQVCLTDRQTPVDVAEAGDVAKVLAFCERHSADAPPAREKTKQAA